ncbi:MAG: type I restriction endonuclease [Paracoccaceae bacterium]
MANNVFHVTAEFSVERTASSQISCDIVAFVDSIPMLVIENKRPTERLKRGGRPADWLPEQGQHPQLFHFRAAADRHESKRGALCDRRDPAEVLADAGATGRRTPRRPSRPSRTACSPRRRRTPSSLVISRVRARLFRRDGR